MRSGRRPPLALRRVSHHWGPHSIVKLTLRLRHPDAEALILAAGALGLSYGEYVAKLVNGTPLPAQVVERADGAALLASTDQLAVVVTDLHAFMRLLAKLDMRGMDPPCRDRMRSLDADIQRHIDLVSRLIAGAD